MAAYNSTYTTVVRQCSPSVEVAQRRHEALAHKDPHWAHVLLDACHVFLLDLTFAAGLSILAIRIAGEISICDDCDINKLRYHPASLDDTLLTCTMRRIQCEQSCRFSGVHPMST